MPDAYGWSSLDELAAAGYVTEDWARWHQGQCGSFALAMIALYPHLRLGVAGHTENGGGDASDGWAEDHFFAHDDQFAYDSAGRHPLPYHGVHGDMDYAELDTEPGWWDIPEAEAGPEGIEANIDAAIAHIRKHNITPA